MRILNKLPAIKTSTRVHAVLAATTCRLQAPSIYVHVPVCHRMLPLYVVQALGNDALRWHVHDPKQRISRKGIRAETNLFTPCMGCGYYP